MFDFEDDIKRASACIADSGVILYPTDTIWGIGGDAFNLTVIDKIFSVKKRPKDKSLIVLLADARDIIKYVAAPHPDIIDIVQSFTRPTTVIYDNALGFPNDLIHDDGSIGIRVTTDPFCKSLIKRIKAPLISTSANISGSPSPQIFTNVEDDIKNNVDYVVRHRQNDTKIAEPSRIVRINDDGSLNIIRG